MSNIYYRLWKGEDKKETNNEFQSLVMTFSSVVDDVFSNRNISLNIVGSIGYDARLYSCEYNGIARLLLITPLKNSGTEHIQYNKRALVPHTLNMKEGTRIYVLSHYSTGDKIIYVTAEITDMLQNAQAKGVYYSLWVDYSKLKKCWEKESCSWIDQNNRNFNAITSEKMRNLSDKELIKEIFFQDDELNIDKNDNILEINDKPELFDDKVYFENGMKLPRNKSLVERALARENYKCELCGCDITFPTDEDRQYFEGHHLIMYNYNVQKRYKYSLDNINNIVCLCPNCHKKIHLATNEEKESCVIKLLGKHTKLYEIYDIQTSKDVEAILNDYFKGVLDDE